MKLLKYGISTNEIEKYLENVPGFVGCFPSNMIPSKVTLPCTIIINTAKHKYPGVV